MDEKQRATALSSLFYKNNMDEKQRATTHSIVLNTAFMQNSMLQPTP